MITLLEARVGSVLRAVFNEPLFALGSKFLNPCSRFSKNWIQVKKQPAETTCLKAWIDVLKVQKLDPSVIIV